MFGGVSAGGAASCKCSTRRASRSARARLGETPWPGTSALYVAEVELTAPGTEGLALWSAMFAAAEPGLPHDEASATFSFRTARPPEHRVTVQVVEKETEAPLEDVEVRLGVYRASTDAAGLASLELPGGVYELNAWKISYETTPQDRGSGQGSHDSSRSPGCSRKGSRWRAGLDVKPREGPRIGITPSGVERAGRRRANIALIRSEA